MKKFWFFKRKPKIKTEEQILQEAIIKEAEKR